MESFPQSGTYQPLADHSNHRSDFARFKRSPVVNMRGQLLGGYSADTEVKVLILPFPRKGFRSCRSGLDFRCRFCGPAAATNVLKRCSLSDGLSFFEGDCRKSAYFEKAVESDSDYAEAWARQGFCHEKLGHHNEAMTLKKTVVSGSAESYFTNRPANFYLKQYRESQMLIAGNQT